MIVTTIIVIVMIVTIYTNVFLNIIKKLFYELYVMHNELQILKKKKLIGKSTLRN